MASTSIPMSDYRKDCFRIAMLKNYLIIRKIPRNDGKSALGELAQHKKLIKPTQPKTLFHPGFDSAQPDIGSQLPNLPTFFRFLNLAFSLQGYPHQIRISRHIQILLISIKDTVSSAVFSYDRA